MALTLRLTLSPPGVGSGSQGIGPKMAHELASFVDRGCTPVWQRYFRVEALNAFATLCSCRSPCSKLTRRILS